MTTPSKAEMLETLRVMLRDVFRLRSDGVAYARLARAHGYVDGYMRAMIELGVLDRDELLEIVVSERERSTPAIGSRSSLVEHAA